MFEKRKKGDFLSSAVVDHGIQRSGNNQYAKAIRQSSLALLSRFHNQPMVRMFTLNSSRSIHQAT